MFETIDKSKMNEGEKNFLASVESGVKAELAETAKGFATAEDVAKQKEEIAAAIQSVKSSIETLKPQVAASKGIADVMAEKYADFMVNGKLDVQAVKSARKSISFNVARKAAATTLVSTNVNAANLGVAVLPGVDRYPREWSPIRDISSLGMVSAPTLIIAEYSTGEGGANWTEEGATKPLMDGDFSQRTITAGKVAVRYKVSDELLADFPAFEAELRSEAIDSLGMKESYGILNGSGTSGEITGVEASMPAYTMSGHAVANPNYLDAIYAAMAQISKDTYFNYQPNGVLINVADYASMMATKDSNGRPLWDSYERFFQGVKFIPVTNNVLSVGSFIVGDFSKLEIRDREPLRVEIGWENDDFSKNLVTIVVEKRLMAYIKNQHINAFVSDTFSNVITAITPAP